jgi:cell wall-associated NlpC family hydrolase
MKKLALITAMTLTLTTCGASSNAITRIEAQIEEPEHISLIDMIVQTKQAQTLLEEQVQQFEAAQLRAEQMQIRIKQLKKYVSNTWYVFSGSTPDGWDCSGLVLWFYKDFNLELEHSATKQKFSGKFTDAPLPGDVVSFSQPGTEMAYHNGIYIGNDLFIHSPRVGRQTKMSSVKDYAGKHSKISYTRLIF